MLFSACARFVTALVHSLGSCTAFVTGLLDSLESAFFRCNCFSVGLVVFGGFVSGRSTWWQAK